MRFVDEGGGRKSVQFALHFEHDLLNPTPVSLDFGANLDDFPLPVSVATSGTFDVDVSAVLDLGFGIDLSNLSLDNLADLFFLDPNSRVAVTALANGQNLSATVSFAGISAGLTNGIFILDSDASNTIVDDPISLGFSLNKPGGAGADNRVQIFSDELPASFQFDPPAGGLKAQFDITAPLVSGTPQLVVTVPDITAFSTLDVDLPEFDFSAIQLDLSTIIQGIDALLTLLENGLRSDLVSQLPLVGDGLSDVGAFIEEFHTNVFVPIRDALLAFDAVSKSQDQVRQFIQEQLFNFLGGPRTRCPKGSPWPTGPSCPAATCSAPARLSSTPASSAGCGSRARATWTTSSRSAARRTRTATGSAARPWTSTATGSSTRRRATRWARTSTASPASRTAWSSSRPTA
jgi:hypothetical protein